MSGARLWAFLAGSALVVVPSVCGVYNGATLLGVLMMAGVLVVQFVGRRD
jgi:hypothetical protein